jgi:hypothetical protein
MNAMNKMILGLASAAALAFAVPAVAQLKAPDAPAKAPAKIDVPTGVFYAGMGPTQYLVKTRLIGQPVVDKAGAKLAVVEDVILGTTDNKIDGLLLDANGKKLGVRLTAFKIDTKDGKTTIALPQITGDMLKVLPAYGAKK